MATCASAIYVEQGADIIRVATGEFGCDVGAPCAVDRTAIDEARYWIGGAAEPLHVTIPHLHYAPVVAGRDVGEGHVLFGVAAYAVLARPVGVRDHHHARIDDPADDCDMAHRQP